MKVHFYDAPATSDFVALIELAYGSSLSAYLVRRPSDIYTEDRANFSELQSPWIFRVRGIAPDLGSINRKLWSYTEKDLGSDTVYMATQGVFFFGASDEELKGDLPLPYNPQLVPATWADPIVSNYYSSVQFYAMVATCSGVAGDPVKVFRLLSRIDRLYAIACTAREDRGSV